MKIFMENYGTSELSLRGNPKQSRNFRKYHYIIKQVVVISKEEFCILIPSVFKEVEE